MFNLFKRVINKIKEVGFLKVVQIITNYIFYRAKLYFVTVVYSIRQKLFGHKKSGAKLIAAYDLKVGGFGYEVLNFIVQAEYRRVLQSLDTIEFIIIPNASKDDMFREHHNFKKNESLWRLNNLIIPAINLLPSVSSIKVFENRVEAKEYIRKIPLGNVFPVGYSIDLPVKSHHTVNVVNIAKEFDVRVLHSSDEAKQTINKFFLTNDLSDKRIVTITLRESEFNQCRNSNVDEWIKFINEIDKSKYQVLLLRDTFKVFNKKFDNLNSDVIYMDVAAYNIDIRLALYEKSFVNLFINNGPTTMTFYSNANFVAYYLDKENCPGIGKSFYENSNFAIGSDKFLEVHGPLQRTFWGNDNCENIMEGFSIYEKVYEESLQS